MKTKRHIPELGIENLCFIKAGAHDGKTNDWFCDLEQRYHWKGVCLEPQPAVFENLREHYASSPSIQVIRGALMPSDGETILYSIRHPHSEFQFLCSMLASTDRTLLLANARIEASKFAIDPTNLPDYVFEETVPCFSLATLIDTFNIVPDLIALDIEGGELGIIRELDTIPHRPRFVFYEQFHMNEHDRRECQLRLNARGYSLRGIAEYDIDNFNVLALIP